MLNYAPLHVHCTTGSIGDSILRLQNYILKAKELELNALALTDHGSLSSFMTFYELCKAKDIKPIIGCEIYFTEDRFIKDKEHKEYGHLILLAKNSSGLKNLICIHNDAHKNGFYNVPRSDFAILEKYSKDLICLSACVGSPLAKAYFNGNYAKIIDYTSRLKSIFGADFYLEIQPGRFKNQVNYNDMLVKLSKALNIKLACTNDIHYLSKEDCLSHNYHVQDSRKLNNSSKFIYPDSIYYLMNRKELEDTFIYTDYVTKDIVKEALDNTLEIADKCSIEITEERLMPRFDKKISPAEEFLIFKELCYKGLFRNRLQNKPKYLKRLESEIETIRQLGFAGYFLIVHDLIDYCKKENIPVGPGRGSAAGSLVSFLLGISVADPVKYNLLFERFLSPNRPGLPDIDIDIASEEKHRVYDYIISRYGEDYCCFVSTYNVRKARATIKTACRILKVDIATSNKIAKAIPYVIYDEMGERKSEISIDEAIRQLPEFASLAKANPEIIELAKSIENYPSSAGLHPAGIIISPVPIIDKYPLVRAKDKPVMATSLDLKSAEKFGGVKFDLLSLNTLSVIHKTMRDVGLDFDFQDEFVLHDKATWDLIASENNAGLFQLSSDTYRNRMPSLHPTSIQELANCLALVRGPCISSDMDQVYIDILNGKREPEHLHDVYWEATKDTFGVLIYQEQILKILTNIGLDSDEAYALLKDISKKKIESIKRKKDLVFEKFSTTSQNNAVFEAIWKRIEEAGLYSFNKAHATSYALLSYCSAYLKVHYPLEYMCNLLSREYLKASSDLSVDKILLECRNLGIKFLPPDINCSSYEFTVENGRIRIGLCAVKGLGEAATGRIKEFSHINNLDWFVRNVANRVVNKRVVLLLIASGCFDSTDGADRLSLASRYIFDMRREHNWNYNIRVGNDENAFIDLRMPLEDINNDLLRTRLFAA